jgi:hypothetical protein
MLRIHSRLTSWQIIFWILKDAKVLNPTSTLTYADIYIGIPNMIICILMVPLSVFFHYAYSCQPYLTSNPVSADTNTAQPIPHYQGGFLGRKAWLRTASPGEILRAIAFAFSMATENHQSRQTANNPSQLRPVQYIPRRGGYVDDQQQNKFGRYQRGGRHFG